MQVDRDGRVDGPGAAFELGVEESDVTVDATRVRRRVRVSYR
ncbi:hypothetical protein ACFQS5_11275 [Salinirubellus sp. GCM10025899]